MGAAGFSPSQGLASTGMLAVTQTWATGLGAITNILGPSDQALTILANTGQSLRIGGGNTVSAQIGSGGISLGTNSLAFAVSVGGATDLRILRGGGAGIITLDDNASGFARLCLGGTTSSYPAIKRSAAAISFRLADDSGDAGINCSTVTCSAGVSSLVSIGLNATGGITWATRSVLQSGADGSLNLNNNAGTNTTIAFTQAAGIATYKNIATVGWGVPAISATGRVTAQAGAAASIATFTPTADASFWIAGNILMTAFTAGSVSMTVTYTSEDSVARTLTLSFESLAGTQTTAPAATGAFEGVMQLIRVKASTAITVQTTVSAFTGTYNAETYLVRLG